MDNFFLENLRKYRESVVSVKTLDRLCPIYSSQLVCKYLYSLGCAAVKSLHVVFSTKNLTTLLFPMANAKKTLISLFEVADLKSARTSDSQANREHH